MAQSSGSYLITTVAGGGSALGDNVPATSAQFSSTWGIAVDAAGALYIADLNETRIRKVSNGVITTVAGNGTQGPGGDNGPATSAQLWNPYGIALDRVGNLYIADSDNNRIRKVSNGVITTVAGTGVGGFSGDNGPATSAQLYNPYGVAVDAAGNLYIADSNNNRIRRVSNGVITSVAGGGSEIGDGGPATSAQLGPVGIAIDASGNLFVADRVSNRIRRISNGVITTVVGSGSHGFVGDNGLATSAQLNNPWGVAVDSAGNLYIADSGNGRIRKVSNGVITTVAGGGSSFTDGGPATSSELGPKGAAVDTSGNVFVADSDNARIREIVSSSQSTVGCQYAIDRSAQSFGTSGGSANVDVLTNTSTCPWLVSNSSNWITISSGASTTGSGLLTFAVAPNPNSGSRTGTIWVAGLSFAVSQSGVTCSLAVSPRSVSVAAAGATGSSLTVTANAPDCGWNATANASWILVSSGNNGTGSGPVTYTVGINTGGLRTGTITVAGQRVFVNQVAAGSSVSSLASINTAGIVNAASFSPPISSGGFVAIYGQNLADITTDWSSAITNGKLPTSLGGVQVSINGKNGFIYYVSPTQVNAVAQPDTATGPVEVDMITNHGTVPAIVNMVSISPGLFTFTLPAQGTVYADALFNSDAAYVAAVGAIPGVASRPAQAGDYLLLFATGLGSTNPPYPVGQALTTAYPVPDLSQVSVLIAGQPATVLFAGMTYPGLFQINIQVPNGIRAGDQPIVLRVAGQVSQSNVYLTCGGGN